MMTKRPLIGYGVLFVVSYAVLFAYQSHIAPRVPKPAASNVVAQSSVQPSVSADKQTPAAPVSRTAEVRAESSPATVQPRSIAVAEVPAAQTDDFSQHINDEVSSLGAHATDESSAAKRNAAITKLGMRPATPESLQALQTVLTIDTEASNRVQAVNALSRLIRSRKDADGEAQRLLSMAMQDVEPKVATAARQAFETIASAPQ